MIKQSLLITLRRIVKHKWFSAINILGFSVGLTSIILMLLYIKYENSYDSFNPIHDRLFRVERTSIAGVQSDIYDSTPYQLSKKMKTSFSEVEEATAMRGTSNFLTFEGQMYEEKKGLYADNEFVSLFDLEMIQGERKNPLTEPMSIVLSETLAEKFYPNGDIIGKVVRVNKKFDCTIKGVFADYPDNSHLDMDYLISFSSHQTIMGHRPDIGWKNHNVSTFVQLNEGTKANDFSKKITNFLMERSSNEDGAKELLSLRPVGDIYLRTSKVRGGGGNRNDVTILYLFLAVAIFTGLITLLNYINASTAQIMDREMEIGVRKVYGISKNSLRVQFITESIVTVMIAFIISLALVFLLLPQFNFLVDKNLSINLSQDWLFFIYILIGLLFAGFLTGLYPVFFLSSLKLSSIFQGTSSLNRRTALRKGLVVFQLAVAMPLIFLSILIVEQIKFIENKDLGFGKNDLLVSRIFTESDEESEKVKQLKERLLQNPNVINCSIAANAPFNGGGERLIKGEEGSSYDKILFRVHEVDYDFIDTYNMELVEGVGFSKKLASTAANGCILNETAVKMLGWDDPIDKKIDGNLRVIGVVKDFHDYTTFKKIPPLMLLFDEQARTPLLSIKTTTANRKKTQEEVNQIFNAAFPNQPIVFKFLDKELDSQFLNALKSVTKIFIFFSILAIFLAILGLYSLVSFSLKAKKRTIAIRKVMGASVNNLFFLILKEYLILFILAAVLGLISTYFVAGQVINVFAYHDGVKFIYLILAGGFALSVVLVSISKKILIAANTNPINAIAAKT